MGVWRAESLAMMASVGFPAVAGVALWASPGRR